MFNIETIKRQILTELATDEDFRKAFVEILKGDLKEALKE